MSTDAAHDRSTSPAAGELLKTPVQFLSGVGPQRAELLARLGLQTARDVLFFFPREYEESARLQRIADLEEDIPACVRGTVVEIDARDTGLGRHMVGVLIQEGDQWLRAIWFNQPYIREKFSVGQRVELCGKPRDKAGRWEMIHPRPSWLDEAEDDAHDEGLLPVYPLTEGLKQHQIRRIVSRAVDKFAGDLEEVFPEALLAEWNLAPLGQSIAQIHAPPSRDALSAARRRLVFQELLTMQLALSLRRWQRSERLHAPPLPTTTKIDARIVRRFGFRLTEGQRRAIDEVTADMSLTRPMNRLLHGDVGSGKTVVALYAMLTCIANGYQAVLMAPTELLAQQHFATLEKTLQAASVRCALLTGGLSDGQRKELLSEIAAGRVDLVVGTQAVIQADVQFAKLGLVVIDEQHKFGVLERASLKNAGIDPHYLVMTATPIPRTLSLTVFGDLDVSTLPDAPPGRREVQTYWIQQKDRGRWWDFVAKKLREGRQAYVVAPLVDDTVDEPNDADERQTRSAETAYEELANGPLEAFRLGLVHGRMTSREKDAAMEAFRHGQTQVLVATSVIEVGVDVPNATVMTIEGAERFGLAQLHQIRGRILRGALPGFCGVFATASTDAARERLEAFVGTTDGFALAETDFALRGPGEILGTRQHGLPPLRIADLARDKAILEETRRAAAAIFDSDPGLARPEHALLKQRVVARYGRSLELGEVG